MNAHTRKNAESARHLIGEVVEVYVNLNQTKKGDEHATFSVRHKGKVYAHAKNVELIDVEFKIQEGGRARAVAQGKRNVHAFVKGILVDVQDEPVKAEPRGEAVSYNPFNGRPFYGKFTGKEYKKADAVVMGYRYAWTEI